MAWLGYLYALLVGAASLAAVGSGRRRGAAPWRGALLAVSLALGLAGVLVHLGGDPAPLLRRGWPFVLPLVVAGPAVELVSWYRRAFQGEWAGGERSDPQLRSLLWVPCLGVLAALAPLFWMNAQLAFG